MADEELTTYFADRLAPLGRVTTRRMFGAHCLFIDGATFGIVDEGRLFLKVDAATKPRFVEAGGTPFTYHAKNKGTSVQMSYVSVPDEDVDDLPALLAWGRLAAEVARARAGARKPRKTTAKKKGSTRR